MFYLAFCGMLSTLHSYGHNILQSALLNRGKLQSCICKVILPLSIVQLKKINSIILKTDYKMSIVILLLCCYCV